MNRTLVVTGASRGIGAACAIRAARDGWNVVVNYNASSNAADAVVARIRGDGGDAMACPGNVASEVDVVRLFDSAESKYGPVLGLINNAGILEAATSFDQISLARWERLFATNAAGCFLVAREAARRMLRGGTGGAIVNMSSMAAPLGAAGSFIDYAATKGAVESMTIGMAGELGPHGIRVNAIRPGLIETEMQAASGDPDRAQRLSVSVPLRRPGTAAEVAEAAVWLISDAASYVTGAILPVSGGR